jgi:energy-coupling factor transport system ATP-binding protein
MTDLALEAVSYRYPESGTLALDGVDLQVAAGERVALIGQNGSGKSTLARHLNGLLRPTSGRVLHDGRDVGRRTVAELARSVGLAFQDPDRQIFRGTVRSEVEFGPRNLGMGGAGLREAVDAALAEVGLDGEAGTNPYDLGVSRRKLLALASVQAMGTPVLVLDEPTTGQDLRGVDIVRRAIEEAHRDGRTVIAISHHMEFVAETFDRVVVLLGGRVILDAPPASAFAEASWETLRSTYLEPPLPAVLGSRLGLGETPTERRLLAALTGATSR